MTRKKTTQKHKKSTISQTVITAKKPAAKAATPQPVVTETTMSKPEPLARLGKILPWILIICGIIGVIASYAITVEKFDLLKNPNYQPVCDLNPIISCGSVMKSNQANTFGFMNTYIGLLGFPVLITTGVTMLAGARLKRWYWLGMLAGLTFGVAFAYWLLFESIYSIRALCPWCLSVDIAITTIWWYLLLYCFQQGFIHLPRRLNTTRMRAMGSFVRKHHADVLVFWFVLTTAEILHHFWYYFGSHL